MTATKETPSLVFTGTGATYRPGNGHVIHYKKVGVIYYHLDTLDAVVRALEHARCQHRRIRIYYGDTKTGKDWLEESDVEGTLGNSMGPLKVPLLVHNSRSTGGPALLDHCIVKIKLAGKNGAILFQHPGYHTGTFTVREIGPAETCHGDNLRSKGYTHAVDVNGQNHANFKSFKAARRFVAKMTG